MNNRISFAWSWVVFGLLSVGAFADATPERLAPIAVTASSFETAELRPELGADGDPGTRWSSTAADPQWITLDLGRPQAIGKIVLDWEAACAELYQVQASEDNQNWHVLFAESKGAPGRKEIVFAPTTARFVRVLGIKRKTGWGYSLHEFAVYPGTGAAAPLTRYPAANTYRFDRSALQPAAYFGATAGNAPAGHYPIWMSNRQGYWTVAGTDEGPVESLICEDGTIELYSRGWSLMPYLDDDGRLITAQDVRLSQSLADNYLPIPTVTWEHDGLVFSQTLFVSGAKDANMAYALYRIENRRAQPAAGRFFLTFRPFQVTPSWQGEGGAMDIFSLEMPQEENGHVARVNGRGPLYCLTAPEQAGAVTYQEGEIMDFIAAGKLPPHTAVHDPWGGASGALQYHYNLAAGAGTNYIFAAPLGPQANPASLTASAVEAERTRALAGWRNKLNRIKLELPDPYLFDVLRANLAYILINRDGPVLQPGPRHYERSWIRDGCMIGIALLRCGYREEVRDYIDWIADRQLFSGDVPCMINADGSVWDWGRTLPEYDGQGAFVTLVAEYYQFTGDRDLLARRFTNIVKALEFAAHLRAQRLTGEYRDAQGEKARYYGLLPLSVSHEGYAAPGKHSYWDDFWALRGWRAGAEMARILGQTNLLPWMENEANDLRACLLQSIELTQAAFQTNYIPGCADLGDFDASATAIALWPAAEWRHLPQDELRFTFDKYYAEVLTPRLRGTADPTSGYVPYEMRLGTAFLIMGEKRKAWDLARHFLGVTRPHGWNQWAEVVYGEPRTPGYIGDMPHSWAGADYINMVRTMFAWEDEGRLVLGLGLDEQWLAYGISVQDLPTHFGRISYTLKAGGNGTVEFNARGDARTPPAGFVLTSPRAAPIKSAQVNGGGWKDFSEKEVRFDYLPSEIVIAY